MCNSVFLSHCFALSWPGRSCKWELVLNWPTWWNKGERKYKRWYRFPRPNSHTFMQQPPVTLWMSCYSFTMRSLLPLHPFLPIRANKRGWGSERLVVWIHTQVSLGGVWDSFRQSSLLSDKKTSVLYSSLTQFWKIVHRGTLYNLLTFAAEIIQSPNPFLRFFVLVCMGLVGRKG